MKSNELNIYTLCGHIPEVIHRETHHTDGFTLSPCVVCTVFTQEGGGSPGSSYLTTSHFDSDIFFNIHWQPGQDVHKPAFIFGEEKINTLEKCHFLLSWVLDPAHVVHLCVNQDRPRCYTIIFMSCHGHVVVIIQLISRRTSKRQDLSNMSLSGGDAKRERERDERRREIKTLESWRGWEKQPPPAEIVIDDE